MEVFAVTFFYRLIIILFLCAALLASCADIPQAGPSAGETRCQKFQTSFFGLFDTLITVAGYTETQAEFDRFAGVIYDRMEELHRLYDIYHEYEGLNNLCTVNNNAGLAPVAVDREIIDLLLLAREWCGLSGGAVNVALGPVLRIWSEYRAEGKTVPPPDRLHEAAGYTDINGMVIDEDAGTVFLEKAGMSLDVGSVAKAYATQLAVRAAEDAGMRSALISSGGNIVSLGKPLDGVRDRWNIAVQDPDRPYTEFYADNVYFSGLTMSCSGGYIRFYTVEGQQYHHIIDPDTLMPANRYKQVAVIHENAGLADLLSTALFILPYEQGAELAAECGADALWIDIYGQWRMTDGYTRISKTLSGYSHTD